MARRFGSLFPNYFALVMATGIISVAAQQLGRDGVGWALFACNIAAYLLFWAAGLVRLVQEGPGLLLGATRHESGPGFLSIVAGTGILGSQFAGFHLATWVVPGLFGAAVLIWWIIVYGFLAGVTEGRSKPSLESGLSGQWLLVVVATQSLAVLGSDVLKQFGSPPGLAFICYAWVLLGGVYYLLLGSIVLYRFAFMPMSADEVTGPWWINVGAAAITVLAGTKLMAIPTLHVGPFVLRDLLSPLMIAFWADATFWIPLLLLLFAWKHVIRHRRFSYVPGLWSVVFPLGMYCAATLQAETAYGIPFLHLVARGFFWVAFLVWAVTMCGALSAAARVCLRRG